ncbi:MAG TPA: cardiolipin synthase [Candidatus Lumbricidophila sp.]|nr:cardiolipin synthase [Candidatus Lumbricidophila sp.]
MDWGLIALIGLIAIDAAIKITAIFVVPRNRRPSAAVAWLLLIMFLPYVGLFFLLLIGSTKLPAKRRRLQAEMNEAIRDASAGNAFMSNSDNWPEWLHGVADMNRNLGALPFTSGNSATLISGYTESFDAMIAAIDEAQVEVRVEFYIVIRDAATIPFFDALARAIERGVRVRLLFDHVASARIRGYRETVRWMTAAGVDWHRMLPVRPWKGQYQRPDLRNHRKLLIVDGTVAFTGSQNIIDRGYHRKRYARRGLQWVEAMAKFEGPVVSSLNAVFVSDWVAETGQRPRPLPAVPKLQPNGFDCQVVPSGPGFPNQNNLMLFLALLYAANHRVVISSPYFVPDDAMMNAIVGAVTRGVRVELFVSEVGDQPMVYHAQRSYYEALLRAGVHIYLYPAPYILHSKHFSIDDDVAVIGTSNMDMRSFELNLELSVLVRGATFVDRLRQVEAAVRGASRELSIAELEHQSAWQTALDNLARLTSALQ